MNEQRIEHAVRRIEAALGRIALVAENKISPPPSVSGLVVKHEALRETVSNSLRELDDLLERIEK